MQDIYTVSPLAFVLCAFPALFLVWKLSGSALDRYFTQRFTVLNDIRNLGKPRPDKRRIKGTAVICGGSIAGLWTARVVADHFEDVLLIEAESWTLSEEGKAINYNADGIMIRNSPPVRSRVMQYTAIHGYQPLTLDCLRTCFPNADDEIRSSDGRIGALSLAVHYSGREIFRYPWRILDHARARIPESIFISREGYERLLRRLVLGSSRRIRTCAGTASSIQSASDDPTALSSVIVRTSNGGELNIPAALVVDCTGVSRTGFKWLRRLATDADEDAWDNLKEEYHTNQLFVRFLVNVPPHVRSSLPIPNGYDQCKWILSWNPVLGKEREALLINRIEGHRILVHVVAWGDLALPKNLDDLEGWIRSRGRPCPEWVFELLGRLVEADCKVEKITSQYPPCSWIHYERAPYIPSNFVAIGDSVMTPNPLFGQGCTKATMGAVTLDALLRQVDGTTLPSDFGRTFFSVHFEKIFSIWASTKSIDYLWQTTVPARSEKRSDLWLPGFITYCAFELAGLDADIDNTLYQASFFLAPPTRLFKPSFMIKLLLFIVRKGFQRDAW